MRLQEGSTRRNLKATTNNRLVRNNYAQGENFSVVISNAEWWPNGVLEIPYIIVDLEK